MTYVAVSDAAEPALRKLAHDLDAVLTTPR